MDDANAIGGRELPSRPRRHTICERCEERPATHRSAREGSMCETCVAYVSGRDAGQVYAALWALKPMVLMLAEAGMTLDEVKTAVETAWEQPQPLGGDDPSMPWPTGLLEFDTRFEPIAAPGGREMALASGFVASRAVPV